MACGRIFGKLRLLIMYDYVRLRPKCHGVPDWVLAQGAYCAANPNFFPDFESRARYWPRRMKSEIPFVFCTCRKFPLEFRNASNTDMSQISEWPDILLVAMRLATHKTIGQWTAPPKEKWHTKKHTTVCKLMTVWKWKRKHHPPALLGKTY